jgi:putative ABC transport system permease protein
VALTVVLLVAAGLMVRSFVNVVTADPGFDARNALTARVALGGDLEKCRELLDRTRTIPGVEKVALSFPLFAGWKWYACAEGAPVAPADQLPVLYKVVSPGYFETMGIRLLQGRTFNEEDRAGSKLVVVVDETLARHYWPQADPIGRRIQHGKSPDPNERGSRSSVWSPT